MNRMKQYIEHDGIKRAFVIKQVERRSFQEIDKSEEIDSTNQKGSKNKNSSSYTSKHSRYSMNLIDVNYQVHSKNHW